MPSTAATKTTNSSTSNVLHYTYTLTNTGNVTLSGPFSVSDNNPTTNCSAAAASLSPCATLFRSGSHPVSQGDLDFGAVTNTATAHGLFTYHGASSATTID